MRTKLAAIALILLAVIGCTKRTEFGPCIGFGDEEYPHFVYETSTWNAIVSVFFFETIFVPIIWITDQAKCPVAMRHPP